MSATHLQQDLGTEISGGSNLPTPSTLITSIISSLSSAASSKCSSPSTTTNPLQNAPPSLRSLLATLHILFPSLLLPALDLLDRHLITKLVLLETPTSPALQEVSSPSPDSASLPRVTPPQAPTHLTISSPSPSANTTGPSERGGADVGEPGAEAAAPTTSNAHVPSEEAQDARTDAEIAARTTHEQNVLYAIRSSQPSRSRSHMERYYTVRLSAWNCSCAAFVFAAFPGSRSAVPTTELWEADLPHHGSDYWGVEKPGDGNEAEGEERWNFGGLSTDGHNGGAVPCCKHLLACVLTERCGGWLGAFVKERTVGREEMAGLACEG